MEHYFLKILKIKIKSKIVNKIMKIFFEIIITNENRNEKNEKMLNNIIIYGLNS
jgi:hypothetical protein